MRIDRNAPFKVLAEIGWQLNCMLLLLLPVFVRSPPSPETARIEVEDVDGAVASRPAPPRPHVRLRLDRHVYLEQRDLGDLTDPQTLVRLRTTLKALPSNQAIHVDTAPDFAALLRIMFAMAGRDVALVGGR